MSTESEMTARQRAERSRRAIPFSTGLAAVDHPMFGMRYIGDCILALCDVGERIAAGMERRGTVATGSGYGKVVIPGHGGMSVDDVIDRRPSSQPESEARSYREDVATIHISALKVKNTDLRERLRHYTQCEPDACVSWVDGGPGRCADCAAMGWTSPPEQPESERD